MRIHQLAPDLVIYEGDVRENLRAMPANSVQCFVTSDPYFQQRDYGDGKWEGGDPNCSHKPSDTPQKRGLATSTLTGGKKHTGHQQEGHREVCPRCGAKRVDVQVQDWPEVTYRPMAGLPKITVPAWRGAYGLEPTPEMYVGHSVLIRREMWRVLRDDGTQWLNLGDKAAQSGGAGGDYGPGGLREGQPRYGGNKVKTLKPKDIIGIPWRVAFALQADGWYLRSDIIWSKPNPFPESVVDRPSKAHEYIFLLTKNPNYYYDADAVREGIGAGTSGRNKRTVWEMTTAQYPEAHFAVFPEDLPRTCILAGTAPKACPVCGTAWERVVLKVPTDNPASYNGSSFTKGKSAALRPNVGHKQRYERAATDEWKPACACEGNDGSAKCAVGDIFTGSGTTLLVARSLGRAAVGSEVNPQYVEMEKRRLLTPVDRMLLEVAATQEPEGPKQASLFDSLEPADSEVNN